MAVHVSLDLDSTVGSIEYVMYHFTLVSPGLEDGAGQDC